MELAHRLLSTKRGTVAVAALAAFLAGTVVLVYLNRYRNSVKEQGAPVTVLVAKQTIAKGTPGSAVVGRSLFTATTIRESQLLEGAFSDPSSLTGRFATQEIVRGQQLTAADFSGSAKSLASTLTAAQRVVSVPLDAAHGLSGEVQAGDHVDVFAGFNVIPLRPDGTPSQGGQARPVLRLIMQDVPVVQVASKAGLGAASTTNVSLRVNDQQAADLAFASDNGKLWLALRPPTGARPARPGIVSVETMLLGVPSVQVLRTFLRSGR